MKYLSVDIESTGLDITAKDAMILSVGMIVDDLANPQPYEKLPKIHVMVDVHNTPIKGELVAITMNGHLLSEIQRLGNLSRAAKIGDSLTFDGVSCGDFPGKGHVDHLLMRCMAGDYLAAFIQDNFKGTKVTIAGKNVGSFDVPFLEATWPDLFRYTKRNHAFIDPAVLYMLPTDDKVPSLGLCKERAGFADTAVAHTALADAWDVCRLLRHRFCKVKK